MKKKSKLVDVKLSSLIQDSKNANLHTERGKTFVENSLRKYGAGRSILLDKNNRIIAGNLTAEQAAAVGMKNVRIIDTDGSELIAVRRSDLDLEKDVEAKELGLVDNRASELSLNWNADVISELQLDGVVLDGMFTERELIKLGVIEDTPDDEAEIVVPKKAKTKLGDVYQLGRHRLVCGDCRKKEVVTIAMDGKVADITFTSPPYNAGNNSLGGNKNRKDSKYISDNDKRDDEKYLELLCSFTSQALQISKFVIVNLQSLAGNKRSVIRYLNTFVEHFVDKAVWYKGEGQPAMAKNVLNSRFEDVFFFSQEERPSRTIGTGDFHGTVSNVYQGHGASGDNESKESHAATFPVHFADWALKNFSTPGAIVFEPFIGTGTVLIVAERSNRSCFGIELEPVYCDIVVDRYVKQSGNNEVILNGKKIVWNFTKGKSK